MRPSAPCARPASTPAARRPAAGPFLFVRVGDEDELLDAGLPAVPGRFFQAPGHARLPFGGMTSELSSALTRSLRSRQML
jgi:hypothetical protein